MVATVLRIRYRILGNTLGRHPWQLVGFIIAALSALGFVSLVTGGLVVLGIFSDLATVRLIIILAGGLLTLGWVLGPIFVSGLDTTVSAERLAPFPLRTSQIMRALTAVGLVGIPGIMTSLGALATFAVWVHYPIAALAGIVCVPLGVVICVVASRAVTTMASGGGGRRTQELMGIAVLVALMLLGPIMLGAMSLISAAARGGGDVLTRMSDIAGIVSWTPIAAAWAVPADLANGAVLTALAKFGIALATLALFWWFWHRRLSAALVVTGKSSSKKVAQGKLGIIGRVGTGPTAASFARSLMYWLRDPRYQRQLLIVPVFPILMFIYSGMDATSTLFAFSAVMVAFILGVVPYTDVSYDGTAFASIIASGIRGRADRAGRLLGAATIGVPSIALVAVVAAAVGGTWNLLPPVLGASLGLLLTGLGVCAVSSAMIVTPVPAPGDSPFKRVPGTSFVTVLAFFLLWVAATVLSIPTLVLAFVSTFTGNEGMGYIALGVGVGLGALFAWLGIVIGGRLFDRNAPRLLLTLTSYRGI